MFPGPKVYSFSLQGLQGYVEQRDGPFSDLQELVAEKLRYPRENYNFQWQRSKAKIFCPLFFLKMFHGQLS